MVNRKSKHLKNKQKGGTLEDLIAMLPNVPLQRLEHIFSVADGNVTKAYNIAKAAGWDRVRTQPPPAGTYVIPHPSGCPAEETEVCPPRTIQDFYQIMEEIHPLMIGNLRPLNNRFDGRDEKIIADKKKGKNVDNMVVLQSMLNILNILLDAGSENSNYIIPEAENRMLEELRKDILTILDTPPFARNGQSMDNYNNPNYLGHIDGEPVFKAESSSNFHMHNGVLCERVD